MADCVVPGATVTTSPSGFMNMELFAEWLHFFSGSMPASIPRPLVLILDGCGSHHSDKVVDAADALDILLVSLPPNGTHLLQPLDVAVFATLKSKIHNIISELVDEDDNGYFNLSKDDAIKVASLVAISSEGSRLAGCSRYRWSR
ncbi:hypothetical protein PF010_g2565 [Phytophthora fragariae]|uniref:DDE-1 domain-containing protein n=1 Tax=Phytophthora fragariae TaxID=53985 RepID=A0A6A3ME44_9STRA|nr:hypothetical protein PF011_g1886 [Phytophthora fragariae]KAE9134136.1 hypothetical protein PF010_g2565 [Phytophthora fragariae]